MRLLCFGMLLCTCYLTDRDFYFEKRLDGSAQSTHARRSRIQRERHEEDGDGVKLTD